MAHCNTRSISRPRGRSRSRMWRHSAQVGQVADAADVDHYAVAGRIAQHLVVECRNQRAPCLRGDVALRKSLTHADAVSVPPVAPSCRSAACSRARASDVWSGHDSRLLRSAMRICPAAASNSRRFSHTAAPAGWRPVGLRCSSLCVGWCSAATRSSVLHRTAKSVGDQPGLESLKSARTASTPSRLVPDISPI